jgi:hypothetical protein
MPLRAEYSPISAEFDAFLYAAIGEEENGASLSVISALARLDLDPWREGARLAGLPKAAALQALTPMIAALRGGRWERSEIPAIASRLVQLLPVGNGGSARVHAPAAVAEKRKFALPDWLVWAACLVLCALALFAVLVPRSDYVDAPPPLAVSTISVPR